MRTQITAYFNDFNAGAKKDVIKLEVTGELTDEQIVTLHKLKGSAVQVVLASGQMDLEDYEGENEHEGIKYSANQDGTVTVAKANADQITLEEAMYTGLVDEFIVYGQAPSYDDLDIHFPSYIERYHAGETYSVFADELSLSNERVVEMFNDYRKRVAPFAVKWDEARKGQPNTFAQGKDAESDVSEKDANVTHEGDNSSHSGSEQQSSEGIDNEEVNFEMSVEVGTVEGQAEREFTKEEIETYILEHKPTFNDIELDFPDILRKRREGNTWLDMAQELNITSGQLTSAWRKYKEKVTELM